jgi:ADP-ribose pyrophosphatase YjhB (NUDIX family)
MGLLNYRGIDYQIYLDELTDENRINFVFEKQNIEFTQDIIDFIENKWKENLLKDPNVYNGKLFNILNAENTKDGINIHYDIIDYKLSLATRDKRYTGNYVTYHLAVGGMILTKDNKLLIGSDLSFRNNLQFWKFPGGYFEANKDKGIYDCLIREYEEEIGKFELYDGKVLIIAKDLTKKFAIITYFSKCKQTSREILEYNQQNKQSIADNKEMQAIKFIDFDRKKITDLLDCELIALSSSVKISLYSILKSDLL